MRFSPKGLALTRGQRCLKNHGRVMPGERRPRGMPTSRKRRPSDPRPGRSGGRSRAPGSWKERLCRAVRRAPRATVMLEEHGCILGQRHAGTRVRSQVPAEGCARNRTPGSQGVRAGTRWASRWPGIGPKSSSSRRGRLFGARARRSNRGQGGGVASVVPRIGRERRRGLAVQLHLRARHGAHDRSGTRDSCAATSVVVSSDPGLKGVGRPCVGQARDSWRVGTSVSALLVPLFRQLRRGHVDGRMPLRRRLP